MFKSGFSWSGKRDSDSRPRPWQGRALPTELFPHYGGAKVNSFFISANIHQKKMRFFNLFFMFCLMNSFLLLVFRVLCICNSYCCDESQLVKKLPHYAANDSIIISLCFSFKSPFFDFMADVLILYPFTFNKLFIFENIEPVLNL